MTHAEVQIALMEVALELRRLDHRLDELAHSLDDPAGPRSLAAPAVEDGSDRPLNLAAAIRAQIVFTREAGVEPAIQDLCLAAQLSDDPERWMAPSGICRQDAGAPSEVASEIAGASSENDNGSTGVSC